MAVAVNVNGVISDGSTASVPVFDHGFLYGEGVYETLRTYNGEPFLFDRHMARLRASAARIRLDVPMSDAEYLARVRATMHAAGLGRLPDGTTTDAYVRILHTRGVGDLTYDPAATPTPTVVVIVKPFPSPPAVHFERGVKVCMVEETIRNHPQSVSPLIKSNNLLNNALGMQEALRKGGVEGVFRNYRGELAECSQANLFVVSRGVVRTPPLEAGLLPGITRAFVLDIARDLGIAAEETPLRDDDLYGADEAFLTSTTREITPIVQVDDRRIGSGAPGSITLRLLTEFRRRAHHMTANAAASLSART